MVPSYIWKYISGWSNYSGKVKSHKMSENKMGHRGSKSVLDLNIAEVHKSGTVKEQRVDGSWYFNNPNTSNWSNGGKREIIIKCLRCTLMGLVMNHQLKILTKQFTSRTYSTLIHKPLLNPWFITGFSDAEASFIISIYKDDKSKMKWRVSPYFCIHIHIKDLPLLQNIKETLGVGIVRSNSKSTAVFRVNSMQELKVIINHFEKYPLVSAKYPDYLLFKQCYDLIEQKEHLTEAGFNKILALKYNLNKSLPAELKSAFPDLVPIARPEYKIIEIPNPYWISGFVSGDSTFSISIEKSTSKVGFRVRLLFGTCLHIRDKDLLISMGKYFKNLNFNSLSLDGINSREEISIHSSESKKTALLQIKNNSDIENKIIPFFNEFPILGVKSLDYADFKKVAELVKNKEHLNPEGLQKIREIAEGMNLSRKW